MSPPRTRYQIDDPNSRADLSAFSHPSELLGDYGCWKIFLRVKGFGMPLTPETPTFTNRLAKPLRKAALIWRAGGGHRITDAGRAALAAARE